MRNFLKIGLAVLAIAFAFAFNATAQRSFDTFYPTRSTVWPISTVIGAVSWSNAPADIRIYDGVANLLLFAATNGNGTLTATLCNSKDLTNWVAVSNLAVAVSTPIIYPYVYPNQTNVVNATNTWYLPGTFTTPTAATSGWATSYLSPVSATTSGAITIPASGVVSIGFNAGDSLRYINVLWTQTGATSTNEVFSLLSGYTHGEVNVKP